MSSFKTKTSTPKNGLQKSRTAVQLAAGKINASQAAIRSFISKINTLNLEKGILDNALQAAYATVHDATRRVNASNAESDRSKCKLQESNIALRTAINKINTSKAERDTFKSSLQDCWAAIQDATKRDTSKIESDIFKSQLEESHSAIRDAITKIVGSKAESDTFQNELQAFRAAVIDATEKMNATSYENVLLKQQLIDLQHQDDATNIEYQAFRKGSKTLQHKNLALQSEIDAIRLKLATVNQELSQRDSEVRGYKAAMAMSRAQVTQLATRRPDAEKTLKSAQADLVAKIDELKKATDRTVVLDRQAKSWECANNPECENCQFHLLRALKVARAGEAHLGHKLDEAHLKWFAAENQLATWIGTAENYAVVWADETWQFLGTEEVERRERLGEAIYRANIWTPPAPQVASETNKEKEAEEEDIDEDVEIILDRPECRSSSSGIPT
ncbi:uncharacterized protein BDR25DRAFT_380832 [Lindgomyces ingoldianus]|uniref:Uncharacterized protein n=1 Tax=Lindgomyces ingoldianus TaxID=673940 RepID=A0ACB6QCK5_9PLEO|nr:uncharacterized protein BDR25DRAFT_380832 [Lindgomyces ingoldianus]KAF2464595.1 hypothetical protein BDR25DRAFT_380832 [Lindgomyces ingoldianus]